MAGAPQGGAELFFERLTLAQQRAGDDVLAVVREDAARAARLQTLAPLQLPFGGALDFRTGPQISRALTAFQPRAVVAWMNRAARFTPRGAWALVGRLGGYYDLDYYKRCDHLAGNTRTLVRWMVRQGWPASRVHYLPNFAPDLRGAAAERLGVPADRKLILALGRLHENKAFDVLIRALARLPGAHAIIAGDGPERAALQTLAQQCNVADRVVFAGWRQDTAALLAGCDVLACPSRHEPLGNVIVEAFAAGKPVVAAASDGPSELIQPGENGLLVPLEDAPALATSLGLVLGSPAFAATLAAAGRARFDAEFAEAIVLARWRGFLETVQCAA